MSVSIHYSYYYVFFHFVRIASESLSGRPAFVTALALSFAWDAERVHGEAHPVKRIVKRSNKFSGFEIGACLLGFHCKVNLRLLAIEGALGLKKVLQLNS